MNNSKIVLGVALVAIVIAIGGFFKKPQVQVQQVPQQVEGAIPGTDSENAIRCQQGQCEYTSDGTFADATTTLFSIKNPTGAIASARIVLTETGLATSSLQIFCGTTTQATTNNLAATSSISSGVVATSSDFGVMESGLSAGSATSSAPNGIQWTQVLATEYVICKVQAVNPNGNGYDRAFLDITNTFAGRYHILWRYFSRK